MIAQITNNKIMNPTNKRIAIQSVVLALIPPTKTDTAIDIRAKTAAKRIATIRTSITKMKNIPRIMRMMKTNKIIANTRKKTEKKAEKKESNKQKMIAPMRVRITDMITANGAAHLPILDFLHAQASLHKSFVCCICVAKKLRRYSDFLVLYR